MDKSPVPVRSARMLAELDELFKPEAIAGDRYALQAQGAVDTEKYPFEKR